MEVTNECNCICHQYGKKGDDKYCCECPVALTESSISMANDDAENVRRLLIEIKQDKQKHAHIIKTVQAYKEEMDNSRKNDTNFMRGYRYACNNVLELLETELS